MTIEFHCPDCNKLLRTTKAKAGTKSSCPACGSVVTVPGVALESIDLTIDDIEDDDIYEDEIDEDKNSEKNDDHTDVGHSTQAYQDDSENAYDEDADASYDESTENNYVDHSSQDYNDSSAHDYQDDSEKDYEEESEKAYDEDAGDLYSEMIDEEGQHRKKKREPAKPSTSGKADFDSVFPTPARDFEEVDKNIAFYEEEEIGNKASHRRHKECPMCGAKISASAQECPRCGETISSRRSSQSRKHFIPHRGGLILGLGIASFFTCCIFLGVASWLMGNQDLVEMDAGRMDPEGRELTRAGRILGIISMVLQAGVVLFFCCLGVIDQ